jgi:hypothetical protein
LQDRATALVLANVATNESGLAGAPEGFEQEEDFGGHRVVQLRGGGQGGVAAAGDDRPGGFEQRAEPGGVGVGGPDAAAAGLPARRDWVTARQMRPSTKWFSPPARR